MKKIIFLLTVVVGNMSGLAALLPPLYTSADQICSVLTDPQLDKTLSSGEYIESIVRRGDGFVITTNKNSVFVKVTQKSQNMPGRAQFECEFDAPVPRN